jgi:hypothetical protein
MEAVKKCLLTSGNRGLLKNLNRAFSVSQANNAVRKLKNLQII